MGSVPIVVENLAPNSNYAAVVVDNNSLEDANIPNGSSIVLDLNRDPRVKNRLVMLHLKGEDGYKCMKYIEETPTGYRLSTPQSGNGGVVRAADILAMHLVHSVQMP